MAVFFVIGAFIFRSLEHWSFINSFYFVVMTATTVGYGDLTPVGPIRAIAMIEALSGVMVSSLFILGISRKYLRI